MVSRMVVWVDILVDVDGDDFDIEDYIDYFVFQVQQSGSAYSSISKVFR